MASLQLKQLVKSFGDVRVIHGVDLEVRNGEFCVFVGPSGCGKTTLLRIICGLEDATSGDILIDGQRVNQLRAADRELAMVFQSYALYPHMTVHQNMAFGLENIGTPKAEIEQRVGDAAKLLRLDQLLQRKPTQLSGGQRQRVAIGRSIVREPKIFLFDEPLSNLDAELRVSMRGEIAALHRRLEATIIYVTHDQVEAMTMADKIVVLRAGRIEQVGAPLELYNKPANRFVAGFIGSPQMNFMPVSAQADGSFAPPFGGALRLPGVAAASGSALTLGVRPEHLSLDSAPGALGLPIVVQQIEQLGGLSLIYGQLPGDAGRLTVQCAGQVGTAAGRDGHRLRRARGLPCFRSRRVWKGTEIMTPLRRATLLSLADGCIELQLERGWRARVMLVDGHTGRMTLLPPDGLARAAHLGTRPGGRLPARRPAARRAVRARPERPRRAGRRRVAPRRHAPARAHCARALRRHLGAARRPGRVAVVLRRPRRELRLRRVRAQRHADGTGRRATRRRTATSASATRPARSTCTAAACARARSTRWATTRRPAIRCTSIGPSS